MNRTKLWIIGVLLLLLTNFSAATFLTSVAVYVAYLLSAMVVVYRSRRSRPAQTQPVCESAGSGWKRYQRWALSAAMATLFLVTLSFIVFWRLRAYSGISTDNLNVTFIVADAVTHAALFAALLIWMIWLSPGHVALLPLGMAITLTCVACGGASQSMGAQTAVALAGVIGFAFASQCIQSSNTSASRHDLVHGIFGGWINLLFSAFALSAILISTSVVASTTRELLPGVQDYLGRYLDDSLDELVSKRSLGNSLYVSGSKLGSVRSHMLGDPQGVALRGYADSAPGYLRGSCFDQYQARRWAHTSARGRTTRRWQTATRSLSPVGTATSTLFEGDIRRLYRFELATTTEVEPLPTVEVHGMPIKGSIVFTPPHTRWLEASANRISLSADEIIVGDVDIGEPYVLAVAASSAPEPLSDERSERLLDVPRKLRTVTEQHARDLCGNRTTARGKADAVSTFFQRNFEYSLLGTPDVGREEPIAEFLKLRHAAHCEYFATATAMILRSAGVPTRYVTGYVMDELSDEEPYWIARNGDAHAWVEAFDTSSGAWFPVESTPGRTYRTLRNPQGDNQAGTVDASAEAGAVIDNQTWYEAAWAWFLTIRTTDVIMGVLRYTQIPMFFLLVALLWIRFGRGGTALSAPADQRAWRMLGQVDRRLGRWSLRRAENETLHQFAARVEAYANLNRDRPHTDVLLAAADWYRQYAASRYRGDDPQPFPSRVSVSPLAAEHLDGAAGHQHMA